MTNLEKLTAGEVAAENNGTLEQLREVIKHSFVNSNWRIKGRHKFYFKDIETESNSFTFSNETTLPTIPITQLWEELQALKKPEIWWIRVTEENKEVLRKWFNNNNPEVGKHIVGMKNRGGIVSKGYNPIGVTKSDSKYWNYDFGNEIDFATFLKYTGVEPEKVEKSLEDKPLHEKLNELSELVDLRNKAIDRHKVIFTEIEQIETKISALIK